MGLPKKIRSWFSRSPLIDVPSHLREVHLSSVAVHTAEQLVILTLNRADRADFRVAVAEIATTAPKACPAIVLVAPHSRLVLLVPSDNPAHRPTYDPDEGWLIPLSRGSSTDLLARLDTGEEAFEVDGINFAVSFE